MGWEIRVQFENQNFPMTEDLLLFIMSLVARQRGSRVFCKISNNISLDRGWHFWCAPDLDLVEVRFDNTIVGYEVKGQRRTRGTYDWPSPQEGLDQALRYLIMPRVTDQATVRPMFDGGVSDRGYLVHPLPSEDSPDPLDLKVISLTPVGFIGILPLSIDRNNKNDNLALSETLGSQIDKIVEVVPAKKNPLQDNRAKAFFLKNLDSLGAFGEASRIFNGRIKRAAIEYLGIQPKERFVFY